MSLVKVDCPRQRIKSGTRYQPAKSPRNRNGHDGPCRQSGGWRRLCRSRHQSGDEYFYDTKDRCALDLSGSAQLLLRKGRYNPLRHSRRIVLVCVITDGARDTRRPPITGATAEPGAIWMGFADPSAVVAICAEPHLKRLLVAKGSWTFCRGARGSPPATLRYRPKSSSSS